MTGIQAPRRQALGSAVGGAGQAGWRVALRLGWGVSFLAPSPTDGEFPLGKASRCQQVRITTNVTQVKPCFSQFLLTQMSSQDSPCGHRRRRIITCLSKTAPWMC